MIRTHDAGTLTAANLGETVVLAGWVGRRRDHGGVAFIDLREASGVVQVVVREDVAHQLRSEFCIKVTGTVERRPEGNENTAIVTGEIVGEGEAVTTTVFGCSAGEDPPSFAVPDRRSRRCG